MQRIYRVSGAGAPHPLAVRDVARVLKEGGLALLPTETVYGIGVSVAAYAATGDGVPAPDSGYGRIFTLKHRDIRQTVPWLVSGERDLDTFGVDVSSATRALARAFWPGALTIVVRASERVPAFMRADDGTVALRASASPVVAALVHACGSPLAVTSANTHGAPAPTSFSEVEPRVLKGVDLAVDAGGTACRDASTIVSLLDGRIDIIRQGALGAELIETVAASCSSSSSKGR